RRIREERGLSVAQAAKGVGWGSSKLSRFETADRRIAANDLDKLLDSYKVDDAAEREALHTLTREAKDRGWWWKYRDVFGRSEERRVGKECRWRRKTLALLLILCQDRSK